MSGNDQSEAAMQEQRKVLSAFFEEELLNPDSITGRRAANRVKKKQEIARVSETSIQDINALLKNFRMMRDMQVWLRKMKEKGEALPETQGELLNRFRAERPMNSFDKMRQKRDTKVSRLDRSRMEKWGQEAVSKLKSRTD